jgi:hypothetical protein
MAQRDSQLNYLIPAEIRDDEFYYLLQFIAEQPEVRTVLEIGASSGEGSTEAFVTAMRAQPLGSKQLYTMEVSKVRYAALKQRYAADPFVHSYNLSSVAVEDFPSIEKVTAFWQSRFQQQGGLPLDVLLGWRQQDIDYILDSGVPTDGIRTIQRETGIAVFDAVLIDGSEFTGHAELDRVYGATYLCLDDSNVFKNFDNYRRLADDPKYVLVAENPTLRNGYAVFKKMGEWTPTPSIGVPS